MAETSGVSLADLIPADLERLDAVLKRERAANGKLARADLPAAAMGAVEERVNQAVRDVLTCDVFGLLAEAWAKARELHAYADPALHPADETSTLFLGEHSLTAAVHPTVDVDVAQLAKVSLVFTVELAVALRLAELTIHDRHITRIGRCDAELSAVLKYGETPLHEPMKSRQVTLTSPMVLAAPGVPIV